MVCHHPSQICPSFVSYSLCLFVRLSWSVNVICLVLPIYSHRKTISASGQIEQQSHISLGIENFSVGLLVARIRLLWESGRNFISSFLCVILSGLFNSCPSHAQRQISTWGFRPTLAYAKLTERPGPQEPRASQPGAVCICLECLEGSFPNSFLYTHRCA